MQTKRMASGAQLNVGNRPACKGVTEPIRRFMGLAVKADDFRNGSTTALTAPKRDFRSTPINGHRQTAPACLKGAKSRSLPPTVRTACYTPSVHVGAAGTSPSWHNPYKD